MAFIYNKGQRYLPEQFAALYPEQTKRWEEGNKILKNATQKEWEEQEAAIKSGDNKRIEKAGIALNSALLKFRSQNPHLFS